MRVLILTGGTVEENFAKDYISKWNPDQVITADTVSYTHLTLPTIA
mgnify:CR=1 FL=1